MSEPDRDVVVEVQDALQGAVRAEGPVVVVTAMSLKPAVREALSDRLGRGHIVRDIRDAGDTADVVLVPAVSGQLVGSLRDMFPGAKILVTELSDAEFGLDLPGPVSRMMRTGVDGYFVAPDLSQLAAATREAAKTGSVGALTAGSQSAAMLELEARSEPAGGGVLRLAVFPEHGRKQRAHCFVLDVSRWLQQLHPDGAEPVDRLRCVELAWTTAFQLLRGGVDVAVSGIDYEVWQLRAERSGIEVVDER